MEGITLYFIIKIVAGALFGGGGIIAFFISRNKKQKASLERDTAFINSINKLSETNNKLIDKLDEYGNEIFQLNSNFKKTNNPILIKDENSANIIKTAMFDRFAGSWIKEMLQIYRDNHLDNKDVTMKKIKSQTYIQLKYTCDKAEVINGLSNYMPQIEKVLDIINDNDVYERVYSLLLECKDTRDLNHFKTELNSLYEVVLADIEVL